MVDNIQGRIRALLKAKNAILLAHNYQPPEIQDMADFCGDSLELSIKAAERVSMPPRSGAMALQVASAEAGAAPSPASAINAPAKKVLRVTPVLDICKDHLLDMSQDLEVLCRCL